MSGDPPDRAGLLAVTERWLAILGGLDKRGHRDLSALAALLAEDVDYEIPFLATPARFVGRHAVIAFMHGMQGMFAAIRYDIEAVLVDETAQTVMIEMRSSRLILPGRTRYANRYVLRITLRGGLIAVIREYVNPLPAEALSARLRLTGSCPQRRCPRACASPARPPRRTEPFRPAPRHGPPDPPACRPRASPRRS